MRHPWGTGASCRGVSTSGLPNALNIELDILLDPNAPDVGKLPTEALLSKKEQQSAPLVGASYCFCVMKPLATAAASSSRLPAFSAFPFPWPFLFASWHSCWHGREWCGLLLRRACWQCSSLVVVLRRAAVCEVDSRPPTLGRGLCMPFLGVWCGDCLHSLGVRCPFPLPFAPLLGWFRLVSISSPFRDSDSLLQASAFL